MTDLVALFPGQGSLTPEARDVAADGWPELFDRCVELVGDDPFERAAESTRFAQPAIFCASMAGWRLLDPSAIRAVAGHSLGELSALAAAGVLDVEDALELVVLRGALMAESGEGSGKGGMLALLRAEPEQAAELAAAHGVAVANDNAPGQVVLSGDVERLDGVADAARAGGLRALRLDVAGAFHSPAMAAAEQPFRAALERVTLRKPRITAFSCSTASLFVDVPVQLSRALTRPVRWRETMLTLDRYGATRFIDVGPGAVLARLVTRNLPSATVVAPEEAHALAS